MTSADERMNVPLLEALCGALELAVCSSEKGCRTARFSLRASRVLGPVCMRWWGRGGSDVRRSCDGSISGVVRSMGARCEGWWSIIKGRSGDKEAERRDRLLKKYCVSFSMT